MKLNLVLTALLSTAHCNIFNNTNIHDGVDNVKGWLTHQLEKMGDELPSFNEDEEEPIIVDDFDYQVIQRDIDSLSNEWLLRMTQDSTLDGSNFASLNLTSVNTAMNLTAADKDFYLSFPDIVTENGFKFESEAVITDDGYILNLYHILPKEPRTSQPPVVFL